MTVVQPLAQITHRELRNNSGEILRRVAAGEVLEVTNHGVVVAVLLPPDMPDIEKLRISGRTRRPTKSWTEPWVASRPTAEVSTADMIADLRGDR